ncbi:sensor histidine kinase [Parendozoicomonas haliclonae]|uniref:histidine kinase n=1 Tax=Parendozoicomonas haliclonae TaxID=1960125 RepID=A0A1X7AMX9_9GAMM|nr:HAMP domain-containing sensor histidine kinase [Parendozoicomonas haliclonae]SMA49625.1 Sporulation kinase E [Parendozoicomonas haliclonae]
MSYSATGLHPQLFTTFPLGLVIVDRRGLISQINPVAISLMGEQEPGTAWNQCANRLFQHRQNDGHEISLVNGKRIHVSTCPLPEKNGQLIILQDLTDSHSLKDSINRQQRLDSMGHLVAALAHQLRTPLTTATLQAGNLEWLLQETQSSDDCLRLVSSLQNELTVLEQKISDLLLFARGGRVLHDITTLQQLHIDLQVFLNSGCWSNLNITCQTQFSEYAHQLRCNRNTLFSALGNLLNNAREAGADSIGITLSSTAEHLAILVQDNGPGMNDMECHQALTPFYTTKGTGTGLGLPVVRLIAEAHDGSFTLLPSVDSGLLALITLPLAVDILEPQTTDGQTA